MSDLNSFFFGVATSLTAGIILMNFETIKSFLPSKSHRKTKFPPNRRRRELQQSKPTSQKKRLARR